MIDIVIPVHNRKQYTRDCLHSLQKQTISSYRVIIVDDGSTDGTREMLRREFPEVIVLTGDGNLFWTGQLLEEDDTIFNHFGEIGTRFEDLEFSSFDFGCIENVID